MRTPCSLCLCMHIIISFWMAEPIFMQLGMYIMAPKPISMAYIKNTFQH
jgi:hypothetical protein